MKRENQNKTMIEKILKSAVAEFNLHGYESASMNHICAQGKLSKGIIYHYFNDKDELYLCCVDACYRALASYYREQKLMFNEVEDGLMQYMQIRVHFFEEHPEYKGLFFNALLKTPSHLKKRAEELRKELDDMNEQFFAGLLAKTPLKESLSIDRAVKFLNIQQNVFNEYYRREAQAEDDFENIVHQHEQTIIEWIHILLYGIVKEEA